MKMFRTMAIVGRLSKQKGLDLLYSIADTLMNCRLPIQFVVGEGESEFMGFFP
jgi:glycogen synthase